MSYTIPFLDCCFMEGFGGSRNHRGIDVAPGGNDFPAWVNGVVVTAGYQSCLGNRVVVKNDDDGFFIGVSHLANIKVSVGQHVSIGTPLGNIGNTGTCSNGRHAHVTVSPSSQYPESGAVTDPIAYAKNSSSSGAGGGSGYAMGLTIDAVLHLQRGLSHLGLYSGPHDGAAGPLTVTGAQIYLKGRGFLPADYLADGEPGPIYGSALQKLAAEHGYTGPIDGQPGTATSAGIIAWSQAVIASSTPPPTQADWGAWQAFLKGYGYDGPIDGAPGTNTYMALQRFLAEKFGYTGPIDGDPGENTWAAFDKAVAAGYPGSVTAPPPGPDWKAWQTFLAGYGYGGPADGEPGPETYKALQRFLAEKFGYTGPIDGEPGDFTWAAFDAAVAAGYPTGGSVPPVDPPPGTGLEPPLPGCLLVDVARYQLGINYAKLKRDFVEAGLAKSAGFNDGTLYIAGGVREHLKGFRDAGMPVGHYYVPGKQAAGPIKDEAGKDVADTSPKGQARWWAKNATDANFETDVFELDNEKLDSNGVVWRDDDAADFIEEFSAETRVPLYRLWVYMGANDWRTLGPWPRLEALRKKGVRFVWAAYGDYPTGTRPDHVPATQGKIEGLPEVHQYTSTAKLGDWTSGLDAMWSALSLAELWKPGLIPEGGEPEPEPDDCDEAVAAAIQALAEDVRAVLAQHELAG